MTILIRARENAVVIAVGLMLVAISPVTSAQSAEEDANVIVVTGSRMVRPNQEVAPVAVAGEYWATGWGKITFPIGTYTDTWNTSQPGQISIWRDPQTNQLVGNWGEPSIGRAGIFEAIRFEDDGATIIADWRVTEPGELDSRELPTNSGTLRAVLSKPAHGANADTEADKAIQALHSKEMGGRSLNVNEAEPRQERGKSSSW